MVLLFGVGCSGPTGASVSGPGRGDDAGAPPDGGAHEQVDAGIAPDLSDTPSPDGAPGPDGAGHGLDASNVEDSGGPPDIGPEPLHPGLRGWWSFEAGTADGTPHGNHCRLVGDAQVTRDDNRGWVLALDGDGDFLDCGDAASLDITGALTLAAWVRVRAFDEPWQAFVSRNGEASGYNLRRHAQQRGADFVVRGTTGVDDLTGSVALDDGRWHHVAGVYDGSLRSLYVDGEVDAETHDSGALLAGPGQRVLVGAFSTDASGVGYGAHNGWLDDVRIYAAALSQQQIRVLAGSGVQAWGPHPADGERCAADDVVLRWEAGQGALGHQLYLGLDRGEVEAAIDPLSAPGRGELAASSYDPGPLQRGMTYYWRVDEVTASGLQRGAVWSFVVCGDAPAGYVPVLPGTFWMGSTPEGDPRRCGVDCWDVLEVEKHHQVTLSRGFWMKATEVTQGEWQAVVGNNPAVFRACGPDCPVENVTWWQMLAYTTLLSQREGLVPCYTRGDNGAPYDMDAANRRVHPEWREGIGCSGYRLPTESEWEYAARAGTTTPLYTGPSSWEALNAISWHGRNSHCAYAGCEQENCRSGAGIANPAGVHPVATKQPNAWGLYDMLGNVWEFVWDVFGEYPAEPTTDPTGPARLGQGYHVARGGSWLNGLDELRVSARDGNDSTCDPDNGPGPHTGFRVCRTMPLR